MIGHYDSGKQIDSLSVFAQTVSQDNISRFTRQDQRAACTKSHEQGNVKFVEVGKAATVLIVLLDGHSVLLVLMQLHQFVCFLSVTDEHLELNDAGLLRDSVTRAGAPAPHKLEPHKLEPHLLELLFIFEGAIVLRRRRE